MMKLVNEERARLLCKEKGIDALLATSPANVTYLSSFRSLSHEYMGSLNLVLYPPEQPDEASIILPLGEARELLGNRLSWIRDVRAYGSFYIFPGEADRLPEEERIASLLSGRGEDALSCLLMAIKASRLTDRTLGLDEDHLSPSLYSQLVRLLKKEFPAIRIRPASGLLKRIRMVKTEEEVRRLSRSAKVVEEAMKRVVDRIREGEGVDGEELVKTFRACVVERGALPIAPTIALGRRSYLQNIHRPERRKLQRGDLVRFDLACTFEHYFSDLARTVAYKEASPKALSYYKALLAAHEKALDSLKPGICAREPFAIAIREARVRGIPHFNRHHCGHGIGLEFYDPPLIAPHDSTRLEEGMVINIEVPYYELGFGGLQVEDTVLIIKGGYEPLSHLNRELMVVG